MNSATGLGVFWRRATNFRLGAGRKRWILGLGVTLALASSSAQTYSVLYNFDGRNVSNPGMDLLLSGQTLYGDVASGGGGAIFKLGLDGSGFAVIYSGFMLRPGLALSGSTLYCALGSSAGYGAVLSLQTDGSRSTVLKEFPQTGRPDDLILSGTTLYGVLDSSLTLFSMQTDGSSFTQFFPTNGGLNGNLVNWPLVIAGSSVYGTVQSGGSSGGGIVFAMTTDGGSLTKLKEFSGVSQASDGAYPMAGLVLSGSTLYGTTSWGGASNAGTIFKINTDGSGFAVLRSLSGDDGSFPLGLVMSGSNVLYGATTYCGNDPQQDPIARGNLFQIKTDGSDFAVLKRFTGGGDGGRPTANFVTNATLYGTACFGGAYGAGVVFTLSVPAGPFIVPNSHGALVGASRTFTAEDLLPEPLTTYQWFFNGTNLISGATNAALQLTNVQFTQAGNYTVVETTTSGSLTSPPAVLMVVPWTHDLTNYSPAALATAIEAGGRVMLALDGTITLSDTITNSVDVTLDGTGHQVTLSGGGGVRPLCVGSNATLSLINLTIAGGLASDGQGGAILNPGGTLNATNCAFTGNLATNLSGGPARGGALANQGGLVNLESCLFAGNRATATNGADTTPWAGEASGGAIHNAGTLNASLCTFQQNSAFGGSADGGAICNFGVLAVDGGAFLSNTVTGPPGLSRGIYYDFPPAQVDGGPGGSGNGGGLFNAGLARLADSTFLGNQGVGADGGEAACFYNPEYGETWFEGLGGAGGNGFGAICDIGASCYLTNCTLLDNLGIGALGGAGLSSGAPGAQAGGIRSISATLVDTVVTGNSGGDVYWPASQDAHGPCEFSILHNFGPPSDNAAAVMPLAPPTLGPDGTLYGGTARGSSSAGDIYSLSTNGTSSSFQYLTNTSPYWGIETSLLLSGSTLYGTDNGRRMFTLNTDGTAFTVFPNQPGACDLVLSGSTLYGAGTGASYDGEVFRLATDVTGFEVLHSFGSAFDGSYTGPGTGAGLVLAGDTLYGTTVSGGGTVYKINTDGSGYALLKSFSTAAEYVPCKKLALSGATLYGTTVYSTGGGGAGPPVIFKVNTDGSGYAVIKQLGADFIYQPVTLASGGSTLFGASSASGLYGHGSVFRINTDGSGYTVLRNFSGADGSSPNGVVLSGSTLYGTTSGGGFYGGGVVFSLALSPPPAITIGLQEQTAEAGSDVQLRVTADGAGPMTYQWFFDATNALAASGPLLELTNIQPSQAGAYTVVVTDMVGATTRSVAWVNVIAPVPSAPAAGLTLLSQPGLSLNVDYSEALGAAEQWVTWTNVPLASPSQLCFDFDAPLAPQRFYRAWHTNTAAPGPSLGLEAGTVVTLTGAIGSSVRIDYINAIGPTNAWVTLDTVVLTNSPQLYFDTTAFRRPTRLYRLVPVP